MAVAGRSTLVVHGRLAMREGRLAAAHEGRHGLQVMSFEQAAVRLAGGFARPIDDESLRTAIQAALPATPMGELENIKSLPGMIDAATDTLYKAWRAGIDLASPGADERPARPLYVLAEKIAARRLALTVTPEAEKVLAAKGYDPSFGARPLRRVIQREVEDPLALALLDGHFAEEATVTVDAQGDAIALR